MIKILLIIIFIFFILNLYSFSLFKNNLNHNIFFENIKTINRNVIFNYLIKLSLFDLQHKTNNYSNSVNVLQNIYFNRIIDFNYNEKSILTNYINEINEMNIFNDKKWFLIKTKNLEFDFPRTIDKYIFLPYNFLDYDENIKTLIHEKFHIDQRFNQKKYNKKYINLFDKFLLKINQNNIDLSSIIKKNIINPDADNNVWLIKNKNKLYFIPYYFVNKNIIVNRAYEVIYNNNNKYIVSNNFININKLNYYNYLNINYKVKNINLTHPNETYVDIVLYNYPNIKLI